MGGGGSKTHENFTVTPGGTAPGPAAAVGPEEVGPSAEDTLQQDVHLPELPGPDGDWAAAYAAIVDEHTSTGSLLFKAIVADAPTAELEAAVVQLNAATKAWLEQVPPAELAKLAAAAGFEHPGLVGLGEGSSPLVHWLDPSYLSNVASKAKIQAKALERYDALCAGETIGGLTLASYTATGPPPPGGGGEWAASPGDVVDAQSALASRLVELKAASHADRAQAVADLVAAENHLATAACPELGEHLATAQAAGRNSVDSALGSLPYAPGAAGVKATAAVAVANGVADGVLTGDQAKVLTPAEALTLCRLSTPKVVREPLESAAADRNAQIANLDGLVEAHTAIQASPGTPLSLPALSGGVGDPGKAALASFAGDAGQLYPLVSATSSWRRAALDAGSTPYVGSPEELTTSFRAWAKTQKLNDLREAAFTLGHPEALTATRAQTQNLIAASWDPALNATAITASLKPAKPKPPVKPSSPTGKPAAPAKGVGPPVKPAAIKPTGPTSSSPVPPGPSGKTWAAKHLQLVEALKHHNASTADLPSRFDPAAVSAWTFTPGSGPSLGGAHTKSFHTAPDGSSWMFKPDKTGGGARAHAEAAASDIFHKVGVPSVPVYARTVGGKTGSIQPLLAGTTNLGSDPASWSQADVDAVVRYHVAAWACGDHDGKPDNLLRTAGGGVVPVDQGQAFKFFGRDKLSTAYHPNSSHGVGQAVFHQAYKAAKAGGLAKGVTVRPEASLPVLAAFERLPDASYRALLTPTATEGAKHRVHWYEPMRARAAKTLGKTPAAVTDTEVADAFLDSAIERKQGLRGAFAKFFAGEGFAGAGTITKVA